MQQSPSCEPNRSLVSQEIPHIWRNLKIHYLIHKLLPPVTVLNQINQILKIPFNIIHQLSSCVCQGLQVICVHQVSQTKPCIDFSLHTCHMSCPSHSSDLITWIIIGKVYRVQSSSLSSRLHSCVTVVLLGPIIFLSILILNTVGQCSSLSVRYQVSHPYKTTGKIIVPYILNFVSLDSKLENKRFCMEWKQSFSDCCRS